MRFRWKTVGVIVIVALAGLFVIVQAIASSCGARLRSVRLSHVSTAGTQVEKARVISFREGSRLHDLDDLIQANYFSPELLSSLIAPGEESTIRWEWPDTNKRPQLLDVNGNAVSLASSNEPMRLGSLVIYPKREASDTSGPPNWSMVVVPGERLDKFVVIFTDSDSRVIPTNDFDAEFVKENAARASRGAPPLTDPRLVSDRLHPN